MNQNEKTMEKIVSLCKNRGFIYAGSEIYGGLANSWDYGPLGVEMKNNVKKAWWKKFVQENKYNVGLDSAIIMNREVWVASGHVVNFNDPLIDCKSCKMRHRADKLVEAWCEENKVECNVEAMTNDQLSAYIQEKKIPCPGCGKSDFTPIRKFNMMFKTFQGVTEDSQNEVYLRPETAQGIFVNFKNVQRTTRKKVPFGIAQIGKSFRNEITPGNFLFRVREFEQMEIEFFCENDEKKWLEWLQNWKETCEERWIEKIGINKDKLRFREHDPKELAFYSKWTWDVEYLFPWGWWELQWIAYRTDYDLQQHMKFSGRDMQYTDPMTGARYVPHCVEPSWGLTRAVLTAMIDAYDEEEYINGNWEKETRTVAHFHKNIAPIKFAILPLVKKDEKQVEIAEKIFHDLSKDYFCEYDDNGAIGKRYRRQDEIWTPFCITVDQQSCEDWETVTIRDRDSMEQKRIKISEIANYMK